MSGYVGAPYNFIPVGKRVLSFKGKEGEVRMKNRAMLKDQLLSGEIVYQIQSESDIYIGSGHDSHDFIRDEYERCIIPGSSMRGLVRSNAQILGMSDISDDIDDYYLMYRSVAGRKSGLKNRYEEILGADSIPAGENSDSTISVLRNVKAGYIGKKNNTYKIYPVQALPTSSEEDEPNYYIISEREIQKNPDQYPLFRKHPEYAMHDLTYEFEKTTDKNGNIIYQGKQNQNYRPGYHKVSYSADEKGRIKGLDDSGEMEYEGYLMSSGYIKNKKVHYVFPEMEKNEDKAIDISAKDLKAFQIDFENRKNTLGSEKNFFNLPEEENVKKPVFYIGQNGRLYFGFTPRLRLFYDKSVKVGLKTDRSKYDFSRSIFGMSKDGESYRSKVSFSDAVICDNAKTENSVSVILASPKPTSYMDYLVQDQENDAVTYNDNFRIRGIKQYWLRERLYEPERPKKAKDNDKIYTEMKPLKKGTQFQGTVHFHNLGKEELGLLLWAMYLDEDAYFNIGMGKPLGYGVIKLSISHVRIFDLQKAYNCGSGLNLSPFTEAPLQETIQYYKDYVTKNYHIDIDAQRSVKTLLRMKTIRPDEKKIRYMSIQNKDYQNRSQALKSVEDVLNIDDPDGGDKKDGDNRKKNFVKQDQKKQNNLTKENGRSSTSNVVSALKAQKTAVKPADGQIYMAVINKISGSRVDIVIQSTEGNIYGKIKFSGTEKKTLKEKYPIGSEIWVKCVDSEQKLYEAACTLREYPRRLNTEDPRGKIKSGDRIPDPQQSAPAHS